MAEKRPGSPSSEVRQKRKRHPKQLWDGRYPGVADSSSDAESNSDPEEFQFCFSKNDPLLAMWKAFWILLTATKTWKKTGYNQYQFKNYRGFQTSTDKADMKKVELILRSLNFRHEKTDSGRHIFKAPLPTDLNLEQLKNLHQVSFDN